MDDDELLTIFKDMFDAAKVETRVAELQQYNPETVDYKHIYTDILKTMTDLANGEWVWGAEYDAQVMHKYAEQVEAALIEFATRQDPTFKAGPPFATLMNQIETQQNWRTGGDASASFADRAIERYSPCDICDSV